MSVIADAIYVQEGRYIEVTAAADQVRGEIIVVGNLVGIATKDAVSGSNEQVIDVAGVYDFLKTAALVIAAGDFVYWSGTAATKTNTQTPLGVAILAAAGSDEKVRVKLVLAAPTVA